MTWLFLLLTFFLTAVWLFWSFRAYNRKAALPPGPKPWPFIGNVLQLSGRNNLSFFLELKDKFGPLVMLNVMGTHVLLLNSWEVIRDAFVKHGEMFNNKPKNTVTSHINKNTGILASNGQVWREHRRFTSTWLRNLGMGKRTIETSIKIEIAELCAAVEALDGAPFDPRSLLFPSVLNVTWSLVASRRFCLDDPQLHQLMHMIQENIRTGVQSGLLNFMPSLRFLPLIGAPYWKMKKNLESFYVFLQTLIDEHEATLDSNSESSSLLREYLRESKKNSADEEFQHIYGIDQIQRILTDLFVAGSETTVTTLCWIFLMLIREPLMLQRLSSEIDDVIGLGHLPSMDDRLNMPYFEAVLAEVQRFCCIVPLVSHATANEGEFYNYKIPKDTVVLGNLWSVMKDSTLWKNPDQFHPNRFLDGVGKFSKPEYFIPFSIGKRACLGRTLAEAELFLFLTTLLQRFSFRAVEGEEPDIEFIPGITVSPKPYRLIAVPR